MTADAGRAWFASNTRGSEAGLSQDKASLKSLSSTGTEAEQETAAKLGHVTHSLVVRQQKRPNSIGCQGTVKIRCRILNQRVSLASAKFS